MSVGFSDLIALGAELVRRSAEETARQKYCFVFIEQVRAGIVGVASVHQGIVGEQPIRAVAAIAAGRVRKSEGVAEFMTETADPPIDAIISRTVAEADRHDELVRQSAQIVGGEQRNTVSAAGVLAANQIGVNIENPAIVRVIETAPGESEAIIQHVFIKAAGTRIVTCGIERGRVG